MDEVTSLALEMDRLNHQESVIFGANQIPHPLILQPELPLLSPLKKTLPEEILTIIAEMCVDKSYGLTIGYYSPRAQRCGREEAKSKKAAFYLQGFPSITNLALVNKTFSRAVGRKLRDNYNGCLDIIDNNQRGLGIIRELLGRKPSAALWLVEKTVHLRLNVYSFLKDKHHLYPLQHLAEITLNNGTLNETPIRLQRIDRAIWRGFAETSSMGVRANLYVYGGWERLRDAGAIKIALECCWSSEKFQTFSVVLVDITKETPETISEWDIPHKSGHHGCRMALGA